MDYLNLKIFLALAFAHTKQDKLDARVVKYIFIKYPKKVNGYKVWKINPRGSNFIIRRNVMFDKTCMRKKWKDMEVK